MLISHNFACIVPVKLNGLKSGSTIDLSSQVWTYQVGLQGEDLDLPSGTSSQWVSQPTLPKNQPLIWYKTGDWLSEGEGDELNGTSVWVRGEGVSGMDVTPAMESEHVQDNPIDEHTGEDVF
ncbi:beta-galactosidase 8-like protein [Corchorus olitorius]|uniref:Beta-galactosidase 8-like protein n=1 Tax=Corchorus olitorius TaxID=93759 RepID=A0A1R3KSV6_9ROSI|nr:beta-galactosidase 8-like protein [Corchorus olitorius]